MPAPPKTMRRWSANQRAITWLKRKRNTSATWNSIHHLHLSPGWVTTDRQFSPDYHPTTRPHPVARQRRCFPCNPVTFRPLSVTADPPDSSPTASCDRITPSSPEWTYWLRPDRRHRRWISWIRPIISTRPLTSVPITRHLRHRRPSGTRSNRKTTWWKTAAARHDPTVVTNVLHIPIKPHSPMTPPSNQCDVINAKVLDNYHVIHRVVSCKTNATNQAADSANSEDIRIDVNISRSRGRWGGGWGGWGGEEGVSYIAIIATISVSGTKSCFIVNALYIAAVGRGLERVERVERVEMGWILIGPEIYPKGRSMLYC